MTSPEVAWVDRITPRGHVSTLGDRNMQMVLKPCWFLGIRFLRLLSCFLGLVVVSIEALTVFDLWQGREQPSTGQPKGRQPFLEPKVQPHFFWGGVASKTMHTGRPTFQETT